MGLLQRLALWALNAIGAFVGVWALVFPAAFAASFPGFGFTAWVGSDGPYNEHLVRDVGALYLALVGAGIVAAFAPASARTVALRIVGVAWLVFSVPHLLYHLGHQHHLPLVDQIAQPVSLAACLLLAVPLVIPVRRGASATGSRTHRLAPTEQENQR